MNISLGQWSFQPGILTSMLALVFFALFVRLGLWQLDRAEYKALRYSTFTERQQQAPVRLAELPGINVEDMLWRRVEATGRFDESLQVLLDNRVSSSEVGYYVYTPFRLAGSEQTILVNRGWVPAPAQRSEVPALTTTETTVTLHGELNKEPRTGILLAEVAPEQVKPGVYRVQKIELVELEELLGVKLAPLILRLGPGSKHSYKTEWAKPGSDEQKHRGYAFQWFAFAATLLVIYVLMNTKRKTANEK